ncbi:ATP-binding protein [Papillibacter cinnamivorans]|uniref:MinD superfamily P-loop ATPase, contains an inserted ferredoxin domain n=1 Tax=Papillibacter cinnamivorans DSM 12816 TaxID=1122930 RepID=A0A1W1YEE9_9FIRM|nr:ATP-binding protein [Papillibacter cinnamivorans]SMC34509.1 MinD superfamily P-loop ATPase, contains an inserted ferredoxin domain [Papillibacter cinnamivorans DSM 12816]
MAGNRKIAVLSGKGGTGKTLISVNLAAVAGKSRYIDCDVEEPNGHLFLKPFPLSEETVAVRIPVLEEARCVGCRKCADFCRFNALAFLKGKPVLFEEVCHSCGGCVLLCPAKAFSERGKEIGRIQRGPSGSVSVTTGILNPGEASGVPIIRKLLEDAAGEESLPVFIDCPPGSACTVMESIKDADYCILVAEPSVFGAHNLAMVHRLVKLFHKPYGVVLNKCMPGENPSAAYCLENEIPVLGTIPYDKELGLLNSEGSIASRENSRYESLFSDLLRTVYLEVSNEAASDS